MANTFRTKQIEHVWAQRAELENFVSDMSRMISSKAAVNMAAVKFHLEPSVVAAHCGLVEGLDY